MKNKKFMIFVVISLLIILGVTLVNTFFGSTVRGQMGVMTQEIGGTSGTSEINPTGTARMPIDTESTGPRIMENSPENINQ